MERTLAERGNGDLNPFGGGMKGDMVEHEKAGLVSTVVRHEAMMKAHLGLAQAFPRDEFRAYERIIAACKRPGLAEAGVYSFRRGGSTVEGASVNLAREMARCWGNLLYGLEEIGRDEEHIHIEGWAVDLQTNVGARYPSKFRRLQQRRGEDGKTKWVEPDERDLRELIARHGAILVRNAILHILPADVKEDALERCKATTVEAASGALKQDRTQAIRRLVIAFSQQGVTKEMLEASLGHEVALINEEELAGLRQVFNALKEGGRREEFFDVPAAKGQQQVYPREHAVVDPASVATAIEPPRNPRATKASTPQPKEPPAGEPSPPADMLKCELCGKDGPRELMQTGDGRGLCPDCVDKSLELPPKEEAKPEQAPKGSKARAFLDKVKQRKERKA